MSSHASTIFKPTMFKHVVGQERTVTMLRNLLGSTTKTRNILFHGAIGSGKTTLARLYGKALNCTDRLEDASPCEDCDNCKTGAGFYEHDVTKARATGESSVDWVETRVKSSTDTAYKVLFLDEAHGLSSFASSALLKTVEAAAADEDKQGVVFLLATTEFDVVRPDLRSRFWQIEIRPLSRIRAFEFLLDQARTLGVSCDAAGLRLLAGLKDGYPRNLLIGLDQLRHLPSPVSVRDIRQLFDIDYEDELVSYFLALGDGDAAGQINFLEEWDEALIDKMRWVQAMLLKIYYSEVLGLRLSVDPVVDAIAPSAFAQIVKQFQLRLGIAGRAELAGAWRTMLEYWAVPIGDPQHDNVLLKFSLFHHLVNHELQPAAGLAAALEMRPAVNVRTERDVRTSSGFPSRAALPAEALAKAPKQTSVPGFIEGEDVRTVINNSSFLIQEHGALFNLALEVRFASSGSRSESDCRQAIEELLRALEDFVLPDDRPFAWVGAFRRDRQGLFCRIALSIPKAPTGVRRPSLSGVQAWAKTWRPSCGGLRPKVSAQIARRNAASALKFHWKAALGLLSGISNDLMEWDDRCGKWRPMRELLGIDKGHEAGDAKILSSPLIILSEKLAQSSVEHACRNGLEPLSAFEDRAWEWVTSGWEVDEHIDRRLTCRERDNDIRAVEIIHTDDPERIVPSLQSLAVNWPNDPRDRARSWLGWWSPLEGE